MGVMLELVRRLTVNQVTGIGSRFESFCSHNGFGGNPRVCDEHISTNMSVEAQLDVQLVMWPD